MSRLISTTSDGARGSALDGCFDFSLCDTSVACHVASRPSEGSARPGQTRLSSFCPVRTNRACAYKQASMVHIMGKVGGGGPPARRDVHLRGWSHEPPPFVLQMRGARAAEREYFLIKKDALSANIARVKAQVEVRNNCSVDCM